MCARRSGQQENCHRCQLAYMYSWLKAATHDGERRRRETISRRWRRFPQVSIDRPTEAVHGSQQRRLRRGRSSSSSSTSGAHGGVRSACATARAVLATRPKLLRPPIPPTNNWRSSLLLLSRCSTLLHQEGGVSETRYLLNSVRVTFAACVPTAAERTIHVGWFVGFEGRKLSVFGRSVGVRGPRRRADRKSKSRRHIRPLSNRPRRRTKGTSRTNHQLPYQPSFPSHPFRALAALPFPIGSCSMTRLG